MKLCRFGEPGRERTGLVGLCGEIRDASVIVPDLTPETIAGGALRRLATVDPAGLPVVAGAPRLGPPVARPGKIVGFGLNYAAHAREAGLPAPEEPAFFLKAPSALSGPSDPVLLPPGSTKLDWEVELAVVIGEPACRVTPDRALRHVLGYCLINDVSERHFQLERGGQWTKGKSGDTFAPLGPWLVTADEVGDPGAIRLWLAVNGERVQDATTADMIFPVAELVSYASRFMTLHPGDILATGTPSGVGHGFTPPRYLRAGDVMTLGADGLGEQTLPVAAA
ncbi:MAG TPA: fumarylacetoacetate hydrolase family protein [Azospirillaceae bacterium]|nr:fumarylacetoacetate hydrolase family protein [Azospirillaceae bacterium]